MGYKSLIIISLLFFLYSCGQDPEEKVTDAIDIAQTYLSDGECQEAIDLLEDVGRQNDNPFYLQVLASAYACRAEFDEITFFADDIPQLSGIDATNFLNKLTLFSTSPETEADSDSYEDLKTALNILLYANDETVPSQEARNDYFGRRRAGDLGTQFLYMALAQLGKFLHFYGNVNAAGAKGQGAANTDEQGATPSSCFIDYELGTAATTYLELPAAPGGVCEDRNTDGDGVGTDNGHPDLSLAAGSLSTTKRRLCEGLMLVTNIIDTLENVDLSSNTSLGGLASITTLVGTIEAGIIVADPTLQTLMDTTSQDDCESYVATQANFEKLQYIYALLFEAGL